MASYLCTQGFCLVYSTMTMAATNVVSPPFPFFIAMAVSLD